jgi:hypothetical protein
LAPTVGIATTGSFNIFHREDQEILRLPIAAPRLFQQIASCRIIFISKININDPLHHQDLRLASPSKNCPVRPNRRIAGRSTNHNEVIS